MSNFTTMDASWISTPYIQLSPVMSNALFSHLPGPKRTGSTDSGYRSFDENMTRDCIDPSLLSLGASMGTAPYHPLTISAGPGEFNVSAGGFFPQSGTSIGDIPPQHPDNYTLQYYQQPHMVPGPSYSNIDIQLIRSHQYEMFGNQHGGDIHDRDDVGGEVAFHDRRTSSSGSGADRNAGLVCCHHQFKSKSALTRHKRESCRATERNPKEYRCDHCGKLFTRTSNLKQHLERLGWNPQKADTAVRAKYGAKMRSRGRRHNPSRQ